MAGPFAVIVLTPKQQLVTAQAQRVIAPSVLGQVTILPQHTPMLCDLAPGVVALIQGAEVARFFVSEGFIEVSDARVVVLAQSAQRLEDIDSDRALADFNAAQARLSKMSCDSPTWSHEQGRLARAGARLDAVQQRNGLVV